MKLLRDVDGDEVSLVRRAANRRRFLLLKGDDGLDKELADILDVPWEREGALLDQIRKEGVDDPVIEKAIVAGIRLLKGVEGEFSPELVAKVGRELYGVKNPKLNSSGADAEGDLFGSEGSDDDADGSASGPSKDGSGRDGELIGSGSAPKVAADSDGADKEPDNDEDDMHKAEFSSDERKRLAGNGQALPDGSFPIRNKSDLSNAIQAYGRASDKGRAKSWIIRRAKALGATGMLPDSWGVQKSDEDPVDEVVEDKGGTVEVPVPVRKEDGTWDLSGVPVESRPFYEAMIEKADRAESDLKETREQLAKAEDTIRSKEMVEKAAQYSHVAPADELAPILKAAAEKLDSETFEKLETLLGAAEERVQKGDLFQEKGRASIEDGTSGKSDAWTEIVTKADELVEKSEKPLTQDQAVSRVLAENPDLYAKYLADSGLGVV